MTWSAENNLQSKQQDIPGIQSTAFSTSFNYRSFGLIPGFLMHFDTRTLASESLPCNYSAAAVRQAWGHVPPAAPDASARADADERPHVVVVLSESFWDPCWLEGVTIDPNPLPVFRALGRGSNGCPFTTVSPVFGGYTCNAEFETLTGIAIAALPRGVVPHTGGFFKSHIPSLPATFKANGYRTTAIHPFLPEFWNRNLIYPLIGFDHFIHIGNITHRKVRGKFISDDAVADEILAALAAEATPAFIFAITMQNHSPYGDGRYGDVETETVRVESPTISAAAVRDYVHGIRDSDAMLEKLTRRLAASDRRVLLVFFGDHQPSLIPKGSEAGLFTQGIRTDAGPPNLVLGKRYMGPALFWTSRGKAPAAQSTSVSQAALPAWILREAGVVLPPFFRLNEQVFSRYPVLHRGWAITADDKQIALKPPYTDPLLSDYHMLTYDLLLGENYSQRQAVK